MQASLKLEPSLSNLFIDLQFRQKPVQIHTFPLVGARTAPTRRTGACTASSHLCMNMNAPIAQEGEISGRHVEAVTPKA
jgi:hypothetical protein